MSETTADSVPAHRHTSAGDCLLSVGVVHMLHDRSMACSRCPWTHAQSRYFEGGLLPANEHDHMHNDGSALDQEGGG